MLKSRPFPPSLRRLLPFLLGTIVVTAIGAADINSRASHLGFVSLQRIATESIGSQAGAKRLEGTRDEKRRAVAEKQKQLEAVRLQLANAGGLFQASRRAQLRKDEERQRAELQQLTEQSQADLLTVQKQVQAEFRSQLETVLADLAAHRGIDLVLNADTAIVWNKGAQDLTADVIRALNAKDAAHKPTK